MRGRSDYGKTANEIGGRRLQRRANSADGLGKHRRKQALLAYLEAYTGHLAW